MERETIADKKSAIGEAAQTPGNPNIAGRINKIGKRNISCLVIERNTAFFAMPNDWKKFEETICKPTKGNADMNILNPTTDLSISSSLFEKANAKNSGNNSAVKKPIVVIINPDNKALFNVLMTLPYLLAP